LKANPRAEVQRGSVRTPVLAREAQGEERARLWAQVLERDQSYATYEARTTRRIPVVALEPAARVTTGYLPRSRVRIGVQRANA